MATRDSGKDKNLSNVKNNGREMEDNGKRFAALPQKEQDLIIEDYRTLQKN
jgi:hypothetical protein